jgi:hypothetical protein
VRSARRRVPSLRVSFRKERRGEGWFATRAERRLRGLLQPPPPCGHHAQRTVSHAALLSLTPASREPMQARAEKRLVARVNEQLRARLPHTERICDEGYVRHTLPALEAEAARQAEALRWLAARATTLAEEQVRLHHHPPPSCKVDTICTAPSLVPTVNGDTVRSFCTHGQQSAAKGSSTTVSRSDTRLIQYLDSSAHGLVRSSS